MQLHTLCTLLHTHALHTLYTLHTHALHTLHTVHARLHLCLQSQPHTHTASHLLTHSPYLLTQPQVPPRGCISLAQGESTELAFTFTQNPLNGLVVVWDPSGAAPKGAPPGAWT